MTDVYVFDEECSGLQFIYLGYIRELIEDGGHALLKDPGDKDYYILFDETAQDVKKDMTNRRVAGRVGKQKICDKVVREIEKLKEQEKDYSPKLTRLTSKLLKKLN
jgi:hypothetical protein